MNLKFLIGNIQKALIAMLLFNMAGLYSMQIARREGKAIERLARGMSTQVSGVNPNNDFDYLNCKRECEVSKENDSWHCYEGTMLARYRHCLSECLEMWKVKKVIEATSSTKK